MTMTMRSLNRTALFAVLGLQGAALGLVTRDAHAGAWQYTVVDGPGSGSHGNSGNSTTDGAQGASAAVLFLGEAVPIYQHFTATAAPILGGVDTNYTSNACNATDGFSIFSVDTTADLNTPGAFQVGGTTWLAYTDGSGSLYASSGTGPVAGTKIQTGSVSLEALGTPSIAGFPSGSGQTPAVIFYGANTSAGNAVHYKYWNTVTTAWSADNVLDGPTVSGDAVEMPNAIYFNSDLWVFYEDEDLGCLSGAHSATGLPSSWTLTGCLDGDGVNTAHTVGTFAASAIDASSGDLFVYYFDSTGDALRSSHLNPSTSAWTTEVVDSAVTINPTGAFGIPMIAPVYNGHDSVYYIDTANQSARYANRGTTGTWAVNHLDGATCTQTNCSTSLHIAGPIAVVERPQCDNGATPNVHAFYTDATNSALREAFYQ
jgi:hypothetical protein